MANRKRSATPKKTASKVVEKAPPQRKPEKSLSETKKEQEEVFLPAPTKSVGSVGLRLMFPNAFDDEIEKVLGPPKEDEPNVTVERRRKAGWRIIDDAFSRAGVGVQIGEGDILTELNSMRKNGVRRFLTKDERDELREHARTSLTAQGLIKPSRRKKSDDVKTLEATLIAKEMKKLQPTHYPDTFPSDLAERIRMIMYRAIQREGLAEYTYNSMAKLLCDSEFSGKKLGDILYGRAHMPNFERPQLMMSARSWALTLEKRVDPDSDKVYLNPVVEIGSLFQSKRGGIRGRLRLHCYGLHGKPSRVSYQEANLRRLAAIGVQATYEKHVEAERAKDKKFKADPEFKGLSKGALRITKKVLANRSTEWNLLLPLKKEESTNTKKNDVYVGVHQGISNLLSVVMVDTAAEKVRFMPAVSGYDIVQHKRQWSARRGNTQYDISNRPRNGRGDSRIRKAIRRLGDAEERYNDTAAWNAVAQIRKTVLEPYKPKLVVIAKMGGQFRSDVSSDGVNLPSYVRNFPFAKIGTRLIDTCHRRTKTDVALVAPKYITRRCPACGHESEGNIKRLPRTGPGEKLFHGAFECEECSARLRLDNCAALNSLLSCKKVPKVVREIVKKDLQRTGNRAKKVKAERARTRKTVGVSH